MFASTGRMSQASYGFCMSTWKLEYQFPAWIVGWKQYFCLAQGSIKTTGAKLGPIGRTVSASKISDVENFSEKNDIYKI